MKPGVRGRWKEEDVYYMQPIDLDYVVVKSLNTGATHVIPTHSFVPILTEDYIAQKEQSNLWLSPEISDLEREAARSRYQCIEEILAKNLSKTSTIDSIRQALGVSRSTVYELLKKYDTRIGPVSLLQKKTGLPKGTKKLSNVIEAIIVTAIDEKIKKKEKFTYTNVLDRVNELCSSAKVKTPTLATLIVRVKGKLAVRDLYRRRKGKTAANDKYTLRDGSHPVSRPLEWVQIDHTLVDLIIVDDVRRLPIGRPWVTLAIDVYTRVILGFYLSLSAPSRYSVACCISHAALPKGDEWLKLVDCEDITYPFYGPPETVHCDNASEFHSGSLQSACDNHNIKLSFRREKHYGGHIERLIGTMMTKYIHFLPGTTMSNVPDRGEYDSDKESVLTFTALRQIFVREIEKYHRAEHRSLQRESPTPRSKWIQHFTDRNGVLQYPPVIQNGRDFKIDFFPDEPRTVHTKGIVLGCLWFSSPYLSPLVGSRFAVKYNPEALDKIWIKIDDIYLDIPLLDITSPVINMDELKKAKSLIRKENKTPTDVVIFEMTEKIRGVVVEETKKTKSARRAQQKISMIPEHQIPRLSNETLLCIQETRQPGMPERDEPNQPMPSTWDIDNPYDID